MRKVYSIVLGLLAAIGLAFGWQTIWFLLGQIIDLLFWPERILPYTLPGLIPILYLPFLGSRLTHKLSGDRQAAKITLVAAIVLAFAYTSFWVVDTTVNCRPGGYGLGS